MVELKLSIGNPKDGKTHKRDLTAEDSQGLLGKRVGDEVKGDGFGLSGYEFLITGGSDYCGFPMRKDVGGSARKKVLITKGVGNRKGRKGLRLRKTVAGNEVSEQTAQVNLKVLKAGKGSLGSEAKETPKEE